MGGRNRYNRNTVKPFHHELCHNLSDKDRLKILIEYYGVNQLDRIVKEFVDNTAFCSLTDDEIKDIDREFGIKRNLLLKIRKHFTS